MCMCVCVCVCEVGGCVRQSSYLMADRNWVARISITEVGCRLSYDRCNPTQIY